MNQRWDIAEILRFLTVGLVNTGFGFAVYSLLVIFGAHPVLAVALSTVIGMLFNYYTHLKVSFRESKNPRFLVYIIFYAGVFLFNATLITIMMAVFKSVGFDSYGDKATKILAQFFSLLIVVPITYFSLKKYVYR